MTRWKRQGFSKQNNKYTKNSEILKSRWKCVRDDHSYSQADHHHLPHTDSKETNSDQVPHTYNDREVPHTAGCDVIVHSESSGYLNVYIRYDSSWREGRRVVELGVLADGLSGCKQCGLPLQLSHTQGIRDCGLGSFLQVRCRNLWCGHVNVIPTGKRHARIWDANTKLATGMIHAGIGPAQVNDLLTSINIPAISTKTIQNRQTETGLAIEKVAEDTIQQVLQDEILATVETEGAEELTVTVDAGWQKRGSGHSFDSFSGHCSMIGEHTGKVIGYEVRSKMCRICESAKRNGKEAKEQDCRQNWQGSSKSMEPSMVISMVEKKQDKGIKVSTVIADDDTTTISRLKQSVSPNIKKKCDKNHIRKNFSSSLYALQKKHKSLTTKVIHYLQKCFNYLLAQNQGNPRGIEKALDALCNHPFGNHESCSDSWCQHVNNPKQRYSSLPYGKPLKDSDLQDSLHSICNQWKQNSCKISSLGSTQPNESFNRTVSLKAPKNHYFSGSASLNYRVAASVAEKNSGASYLVAVNKKIGLSPGRFTRKLCYLRESQSRKRKAIAKTKEAKRRRRELKARRSLCTTSKEIHEGSTYESGIGLAPQQANIITEIPVPRPRPQMETVDVENHTLILFDLETTGLARTSHIVQLAAVQNEDRFSTYIIPKKSITPTASEITGLSVRNGKLYHNNEEVTGISLMAALDSFLKFLEKYNNIILVGHNIKVFDCPVLFRALESCSMLSRFSRKVKGFMDTKLLFRISHPNLSSYSQQNLAESLLACSYEAHNALEDILVLQKLLELVNLSDDKHKCATFSFDYAMNVLSYQKEVDKNFPSLQILVQKKVLSVCMAKRIAGSGLDFDSLKLAYSRDQIGIHALFTEVCSNSSVRVTKSNKIIEAVSSFFLSLNES
ncbi:uncharacterized protein LOC133203237 [Saccostrea echinata]|uniref:uncharacterized protein LOC133203237 n=1 Tax=Saccostrea echinata TaxID=191078 RepID=UPI002A7FE917|nr:uncharacterized protein LOC133203237 [Saccostrea echinata]